MSTRRSGKLSNSMMQTRRVYFMREESGSVARISNFLRHIRTAELEYILTNWITKHSEKNTATRFTGRSSSNLNKNFHQSSARKPRIFCYHCSYRFHGIWVRFSKVELNSKSFKACNNVPANVPDLNTPSYIIYFQG